MKNLHIIPLVATVAMLSGCDDVFTPSIENNLGMDYMYENPEYAEGVLANAYTYMACDGYSFSECATDDAVSNQSSNSYRNMAAGTWTASNNPMNVWESCFNKIMYLNIFLNRCDNVAWALDEVAAEFYKDREKGEAYGLRLMNYYHLLLAHSGYGSDGVLYGVPLLLEEMDATSDTNTPRSTFADCIAQIEEDASNALELLPMEYVDVADESEIPSKYSSLNPTVSQYNRVFSSSFAGRMNGLIVCAYLARTRLLAASPAYNPNGDTDLWQKAADAAAKVIDYLGGVSGIDPNGWTWYCNTSEISALGAGENPQEIIWRGTKSTNKTLETDNYPPSIYGNGYVNPTQNFVDCFYDINGYPITDSRSCYVDTLPYANRDPRLDKYVVVNGSTVGSTKATIITAADGTTQDALNNLTGSSTRTGYYLRKLMRDDINLNPNTSNNGQYHYNAFIRATEMYLDYAEAANEVWGPTGNGGHGYSAYDVIKALHNRCGVGNSYLDEVKNDKDKMRQLIRNERRIELSFEGHRFWDLRRWKADLNESTRGMSISQADGTYTTIEVDTRNYKDYQYYGPIPYSECLKFSNLQQNAGW
ncbi:MAG: RagB/SusD family nutrient uptake outer membrane protein [Bacteroidales bacterium]|nr:RagB/SusD family nutrient uptake outer membrane protein [Bacteroidales bacterium]